MKNFVTNFTAPVLLTAVDQIFHAETAIKQVVGLCTNMLLAMTIIQILSYRYTVEPPKKGHFGNGTFVLSSEVVLFSEVV